MKCEFLMLIITATVCFFSGFIIGITLGKDRCQKKISKILDEALGDISKTKGEK